jgi:hypothetical protein
MDGCSVRSEITNAYLQEAVRTYVLGLPQASIALSPMEQALKEELGHPGKRTQLEMANLLDEAEGAQIIDGEVRKTARKLANQANLVLHQEPADLAKAFDVLLMLHAILKHIYS